MIIALLGSCLIYMNVDDPRVGKQEVPCCYHRPDYVLFLFRRVLYTDKAITERWMYLITTKNISQQRSSKKNWRLYHTLSSRSPTLQRAAQFLFKMYSSVTRAVALTGDAAAYDVYPDKYRYQKLIIFPWPNKKTDHVESLVKQFVENDSLLFFGNCFRLYLTTSPKTAITNCDSVNSIIMCFWAKAITLLYLHNIIILVTNDHYKMNRIDVIVLN